MYFFAQPAVCRRNGLDMLIRIHTKTATSLESNYHMLADMVRIDFLPMFHCLKQSDLDQ